MTLPGTIKNAMQVLQKKAWRDEIPEVKSISQEFQIKTFCSLLVKHPHCVPL